MARAADASSLLTVAISKAIRERRLSLGVSQEELGNRADLHRTYISDIEAGRRNLSLRSLFRLALGLGLSVSDLLKMAELKTEEPKPEIPIAEPSFHGQSQLAERTQAQPAF